MTDSEMVEKVARALCQRWEGTDEGPKKWEEQSEIGKQIWKGMARAALKAMREPTEDMFEEGRKQQQSWLANAATIYTAMIDKALEG